MAIEMGLLLVVQTLKKCRYIGISWLPVDYLQIPPRIVLCAYIFGEHHRIPVCFERRPTLVCFIDAFKLSCIRLVTLEGSDGPRGENATGDFLGSFAYQCSIP